MTALCFPPVLLLYMILHSLSDGPTGLYSSSSELKLKHTLLDGYTPASVIPQLALNFIFMICFLVFVANGTWQRPHFQSLSFPVSSVRTQLTEEKWSFYHSSRAHVHRPSCVATEVERLNTLLQKKIGQSILGKVKLQIGLVDSCGRIEISAQ